MEKLKKQPYFYTIKGEIKYSFFYTNKPIIVLVHKKAYFNTNDLDYVVSSVTISLL